jgi:hypothetical protein
VTRGVCLGGDPQGGMHSRGLWGPVAITFETWEDTGHPKFVPMSSSNDIRSQQQAPAYMASTYIYACTHPAYAPSTHHLPTLHACDALNHCRTSLFSTHLWWQKDLTGPRLA